VGIGIISTLIGISVFLARKIDKNPSLALSLAVYITYGIFSLLAGVVFLLSPELSWKLFIVLISGPIISGIVIGISTNYFTGGKPVRQTAENGKTSVALAVLSGIEVGHMSVPIPALAIVLTIAVGFFLGGIEGVALATLGLMANMGSNVAVDVFGPVADNAKGIAEQAGLHSEAIDTLDLIDATGNTTAAYAKGIANGCAGLSMVTLLVAFLEVIRKKLGPDFKFDLMDANILARFIMGGLLGVGSSCLFAAMTMAPARKIAFQVMDNIKKQFNIKSVEQRMKDDDKPDYKICAQIGTTGALKNLNPPVLTVVITTIAIRFVLGPIALVGYVYGSNLVNFAIGFWMSNAGGNMDNAKKSCEAGDLGEGHGKGSETHKALVAGDTVGDPLKDVTGPGMNSMSALQSLIAIMSIELFPLWYLF
jgi:K(+)-stimulated pyrophosphate-energized sodium pump